MFPLAFPDVLQKHIFRDKTRPLDWKEMAASLLEKQLHWQYRSPYRD